MSCDRGFSPCCSLSRIMDLAANPAGSGPLRLGNWLVNIRRHYSPRFGGETEEEKQERDIRILVKLA
ncbi:Uncharacterized protein HZ326_10702 [Fusarium oxysporum f. sp. albedinis]|nr:Uncharacterized protein HZ326_10702 [Fusarium oxysporum f. sp. albedinis]